MTLRSASFIALALASRSLAAAAHPEFAPEIITKVRDNMVAISKLPWEVGTMQEAVTQLDTPELSVFDATRVPASSRAELPQAALDSMDAALSSRPSGLRAFWNTAAVADSASLGVTAVIAGITTGQNRYNTSAKNQLNYLLHDVPHDGVLISHRAETFQAWADFVSMVPPFIAYYGAAQGGQEGKDLLLNAYEQCKGYRRLLRDEDSGLWMHIVRGGWNDTGLWATGNAWGAYGMLRVQQTIAKSAFARELADESGELLQWTNEILNATWSRQRESGAVLNYMNRKNDFEDSAGTALLAASTFRMASIIKSPLNIDAAEKALERIIDLTDDDGWVAGAVDPYNFRRPAEGNTDGGYSPEAQAFVIFLDAAARNYYAGLEPPKPAANVGTGSGASATGANTPAATANSFAHVIEGLVAKLANSPSHKRHAH
ncbi:Six-hairpin glycosidase [Auricularia subglabra TFB-10046 SS5]|nr:Six-hairpin glycosidase [Auricularia subglabra TFB-10046 SS5]